MVAAGVVLTSVVPSMAMAVEDKPAKVVKEEDSFKSVEDGVKENDKVKAEGKSKEDKAKEDKAKATDEKAK